MKAADAVLAHGYTVGQVDHLAKVAVNIAGTYASDYLDRLDAAYGAIVIALYEAPYWPTRHTLVDAGAKAVRELVNQALHLRGYRNLSGYNGAASAPGWCTYWLGLARITHGPEERVVERVALAQILPHLAPREGQAITALAVTDDYQAGADLLGMGYAQFCAAVNRGRRRARALWHDGETPRPWRTDIRIGSRTAVRPTACPKGHPYDEANTAYSRKGAIKCRRCHRERMAADRVRPIADAVGVGKTGCAS